MHSTGLIDLQVNGYAGVDFNDTALTAAALDHALEAMLRSGVTTCLPTLITAAEADLADRLHALDEAVAHSRLGPLMVPGFHLEGPFLNPARGYAGCHPLEAIIPPDPPALQTRRETSRAPQLHQQGGPPEQNTEPATAGRQPPPHGPSPSLRELGRPTRPRPK